MKKNEKISLYAFSVAMYCLCFLSCKKNEVLSKDLRTYVIENLSAYHEISVNTGDTVIADRGVIYPGKRKSGFQALLSEALNTDVEITGSIDRDPELIRVYDSLYGTHSPIIPEGLFKMVENGKVSIKAGQTTSIDSLKIEIDNISGLLTGQYMYVVPIVLESSAKNIKLKSRLMFLRFRLIVFEVGRSISILSGGSSQVLINGNSRIGENIFINAELKNPIRRTTQVVVEELAIDTYNVENNTFFRAFPPDSYKLVQNTAIIPANRKTSIQYIQVQLTELSGFKDSENYMLALKIKDDAANPAADQKNNVVYIIFQKAISQSLNAIISGEPIDRTGWKISTSDAQLAFPPENVLDGNNETAWVSGDKRPFWLTLDMGIAQPISGFSIVPNYTSIKNDFTEMQVFSSHNGEIWITEGGYKGTSIAVVSSVSQPDIKNIKLKSPVTARYFKFQITKTTSGKNAGMAELYGIK